MSIETRYATSGEASIAYQVFGEGETDVLFMSGWLMHIELLWEAQPYRRFVERLSEFARVIVYDPRGTGLSDPVGGSNSLDQEAADALAVLDAAGSRQAALYAKWFGGPVAITLAVEHPERVAALITFSAVSRASWAPDYDWAMKKEERDSFVEESVAEWGEVRTREMERWAPSVIDDPEMSAWFARLVRSMASPAQARSRWREATDIDVRGLLPRIEVPTLLMHRPEEQVWDVRHTRYIADRVEGARYVELPGRDALDFLGESEAVVEEIQEFLTGERGAGEATRALLTVMFTDIVDSTGRAARLGDSGWRELLARHDHLARAELRRFGGRAVKSTGDGFLATFSGTPSSALHCAAAMLVAARALDIELRVGLHTGECEVIGDDVGGMAVHIASRVNALADPGEVLASSAVAAAVAGGPFEFEERGTRELKGVPGHWALFSLRNFG